VAERGLRDADGGQAGDHSEVTGEPEPAGVGDAMTVRDEQVRRLSEPAQRFEQGRRLAEGEKLT